MTVKIDSEVTTSFISITSVNDAPVNTAVPTTQSTNEDTTKAITGLFIADVDAGSGGMTVTLGVTNGTLTVADGTAGISGSGSSTVTLTGTVAQINSTLAATVNYVPTANFNGSATLTMTTSDNGNTGSGGTQTDVDMITINVAAVNDPVTSSAPATATVDEDGSVAINGLSISDVDATLAPGGQYAVTLTATQGTLTLSTVAGLSFTTGDGTSDATMSFTGTQSAINTALASAAYAPAANYNGAATINITVTDQVGVVVATGSGVATSDSDTINVTVSAVNDTNHPPTANDVFGTGDEDAGAGDAPQIQITLMGSDIDAGDAVNSFTLTSLPTNGTLYVSNADSVLVPAATGVAYDAASNALTLHFVPVANFSGEVSFTYTAFDGEAPSAPATATLTLHLWPMHRRLRSWRTLGGLPLWTPSR